MLALASAAHADTYTYRYTATITSVSNCNTPLDCQAVDATSFGGENVALLQTIRGEITYDTATPPAVVDSWGGTNFATYETGSTGTGNGGFVAFDGKSLGISATEGGKHYYHRVTDYATSADYLGLGVYINDGATFRSFDLDFWGNPGTFDGAALPHGVPMDQIASTRFTYAYFELNPLSPLRYARGELTSFELVSSVPEPGTYAMLLAGLGILAWRRRAARSS